MDYLKSALVWLVGIAFLLIFFPVTFIIWLISLPFDKDRNLVHLMIIYQSMLISYLIPVWKIKIQGREKAGKGQTCVIISNHQSILDILVINCLGLRFKWISKIENYKVPVLGWYLRMAKYITVDRGDKESKVKMLSESYECLKKGNSIMIFPEGTRSVDGEIGFFKRGAFQLAISAGVPILPVLIDGTGGILPKHGLKFGGYHKVAVKVLDPVPPEKFSCSDPDKLAEVFMQSMKNELNALRTASS